MKTGRKYNVTIDGQLGRITDVIPSNQDKGIAWKIGKKEYSKVISKEIEHWCLSGYLYKIILQNGSEFLTSNDYDFVYIV